MKRTNRRAEDFDRALAAEGGVHVDPAIRALVAVAGALATIPQRPAPAFRESLRTQLMAEAANIAASAPAASVAAAAPAASPAGTLAKVLAKPAMQVATGGLAAAVAVTGVGIGASRSLPGDALYGLKRTVEKLQKRTAGGTLAEAGSVLEHANTRIDEVRALLERGGADALAQVEKTLDELRKEIDDATAELLAQARAGSKAAYDKLAATVGDLSAALDGLRGQLPPQAQDEYDAVMAMVNSVTGQLKSLPVPGGITRPGEDPSKSPRPTTPPPTSPSETTPPKTTPPTSGPPVTVPPVDPSVTVPPVDPTKSPIITIPPLPTIEPTLPVTLPPALP
ncbi:MAG TPA: DUF5667 domain-containing protein [Frankiaceae bacterium]|nr:DUF5667 domain-containing protein [Frankiaceae bacterium]